MSESPGKNQSSAKAEKCTGCALCVDICGGEALELVGDLPVKVRPDDCLCCGLCEEVCPSGAIGPARWPAVDWSRCTDCALCVDICALAVFALQGEDVVIASPQACNSCGECVEICPTEAVRLVSEGGEKEWIRQRPDSTPTC